MLMFSSSGTYILGTKRLTDQLVDVILRQQIALIRQTIYELYADM
jgi:hypothetical protein